jgi:hypothetical protein
MRKNEVGNFHIPQFWQLSKVALFSFANDSRGRSHRYGLGFYITGHHAAGSDHGASANTNPFEHDDARAQPDFILDDDGCNLHRLLIDWHARFHSMVAVRDKTVRPNHAVPSNFNLLVRVQNRIAVDIGSGANQDFLATRLPAAQEHNPVIQRNVGFERHIFPLPWY